MPKLTIVQIGVLLFAICLTREAVSNNSTDPTAGGNSTSNPNSTMATGTYSGTANTTPSPTGAGISLHPSNFSFLIPIVMAASLLMQRYC